MQDYYYKVEAWIASSQTALLAMTTTCTLTTLLTACSPVDSTQPFDNQQAANLLKQHANVSPTKQMIALHLPNKRDWRRIDVSYGTLGTPLMLIPNNEDQQNWSESFRTRISDYVNHPGMTPAGFAEQQISYAKDHCAMANGSITQATKEYVIYQLEMSGCQEEKNQMQIGKALKGSDAVYLVDYSATTGISKTHFDRIAQVVRSAVLIQMSGSRPAPG